MNDHPTIELTICLGCGKAIEADCGCPAGTAKIQCTEEEAQQRLTRGGVLHKRNNIYTKWDI